MAQSVQGTLGCSVPQPHKYTQQPHDEPGFLVVSGRGSRRPPINHSALQALVTLRWQECTSDRTAALRADRLRHVWLLRHGLAGFAGEVQLARSLQRQATVLYQKSCFVGLGRAFTAWKSRLEERQRKADKLTAAEAAYIRCLAQRGLHTLQRYAARRKAKQRSWTRAACYQSFCILARALDAWRGWLRQQRTKQRNTQLAAAHIARSRRRHAVGAWRQWARLQKLRLRQEELAVDFCRVRRLCNGLSAWKELVASLNSRREQAVEAIQHALFGLDLALLALGLRAWRHFAARQTALRDNAYISQRLHRYNTLQRCWHWWRLHIACRHYLAGLHDRLVALRPRLLLRQAYQAWGQAVCDSIVEAGQVYHRTLQLPRAFATWRRTAARAVQLTNLGEVCCGAHARLERHRYLRSWQLWAAWKTARRARIEQAAEQYKERSKQVVVREWRLWARRQSQKQLSSDRASIHFASRMALLALRFWRQSARLRKLSACWYQYRMQRDIFARWRSHTLYKALKAVKLRRAVRHRYLRLLKVSMSRWITHHASCVQRHRQADAFLNRNQRKTLQQICAAWSGSFLFAAKAKQAQQARAAAQRRTRLLAAALLTWRTVFLPGARSRRQAWQRAEAFWRVNTLHTAAAAWRQYLVVQLAKRAELAELHLELLPGRRFRALLAWRAVGLRLAGKRQQAAKAAQHRECALMRAAYSSWSRYIEAKTHERQRWMAALLTCSRQRQRHFWLVWRDAAHTAAVLRRVGRLESVAAQQAGHPHNTVSMEGLSSGPRSLDAGGLGALLSKLNHLKVAASQLQQPFCSPAAPALRAQPTPAARPAPLCSPTVPRRARARLKPVLLPTAMQTGNCGRVVRTGALLGAGGQAGPVPQKPLLCILHAAVPASEPQLAELGQQNMLCAALSRPKAQLSGSVARGAGDGAASSALTGVVASAAEMEVADMGSNTFATLPARQRPMPRRWQASNP